jgi:hypothetical protein
MRDAVTWIKVDVDAVDHPKIDALSDSAFRWLHRAWSYAGRLETDGHLPPAWVKRVPPRIRRELDAGNLWHENGVPGGRVIHDWLEMQPSSAQRKAEREATAERARRYRENQLRNAVTNGLGNA